jgi:DNA (cytosine-5)-methyltransferase 1
MTHFDLFAGYGGFTLALQNILHPAEHEHEATDTASMGQGGVEPDHAERLGCIGFSEIDKYANAVLKYHWPNTPNYGDISKIDWATVPDFDLLTGGSPCQDLSIAGKRAGLAGARSGLFYEYMRAIKEKKPKYFIWENVKGALSSSNGWDFAAVLNEMAEVGYSLWWQVLNAKDFGVPQNRERIFVVGFRDRPAPEVFLETGTGGQDNVANDADEIYQKTRNLSDAFRIRSTDGVSATLKGLGGGMGAKTGLYAVNKNRGEFKEQEDVANCLDANQHKGFDNHAQRTGIAQGSRIRRLTPTECERLMGLPDDWLKYGVNEKGEQFEVSDSQKYKMAGNGVVVNVVEAIIKNIIQAPVDKNT